MNIPFVLSDFKENKKINSIELTSDNDFKLLAKTTISSAISYYKIVELCSRHPIFDECGTQVCSIAALSSELFIKAFLLKNKIKYDRNHDLYSLYNLLPDEVKDNIKNGLSYSNYPREGVERQFELIGNAFVELRYASERKAIMFNRAFLLELLTSLFSYSKGIDF